MVARRMPGTFKDTYRTLISHVGGDDAPEPVRLMCRRAAALESELVNLEVRFAQQHESGGKRRPPTSICTAG